MAGKYLRVLYDLDYKTHEGVPVSIREGEKCLLLKKTNDDWWNVVKHGEKIPIYVPANYVEDIVPPTSPKPKKQPLPVAPKPQQRITKANGEVKDHQNNTLDGKTEGVKGVTENGNEAREKYVTKIDLRSTVEVAESSDKAPTPGVSDNEDDDEAEETYVNVQQLKQQFSCPGPAHGHTHVGGAAVSGVVKEPSASTQGHAQGAVSGVVSGTAPTPAQGAVSGAATEKTTPTDADLYAQPEYANLAVMQESIHAKKQVRF